MRTIIQILRQYTAPMQILVYVLVSLVMAVLELLGIFAVAPIVADLVGNQYFRQEFEAPFGIPMGTSFWMPIFIMSCLVRVIYIYYQVALCQSLAHSIATSLFSTTLHADYRYIVDRGNRDELAKLSLKIAQLSNVVMGPLVHTIYGLCVLLVVLVAILVHGQLVALVSVGCLALLYVALYWSVKRYLDNASITLAEKHNSLFSLCGEVFTIRRNIILDKTDSIFKNKFINDDKLYRQSITHINFISLAPKHIVEVLIIVLVFGSLLPFGAGANNIIEGIPQIAALVYGLQKMLPIIQAVFRGYTQLRGGQKVIEEVLELSELPQDIGSVDLHQDDLLKNFENIKCLNLSYSYHLRNDVTTVSYPDFELKKGDKLVILGPSGVGKTTLINILMGFIAPSSGEIKINGKKRDASTINLVRRKCGLIGQETYIVGRTVREAFEYKVSDVQENLPEIRRLSKMLSLCNSKNFESWFESTIEDGGVNLSVGQRQRIAIILEFVGDNELIFMDEFTSALDFESAERTCEIVASSKKTVCAITHSSAVASHFEKVLVIGE